jgi:rhodanese-related sulfurtransferase
LKFLIDNIMLVGLIIGSGVLLIWPMISEASRGVKAVSPTQAVLLINREHAKVLDVRDANEYATRHIADAKHVALNELEAEIASLQGLKQKPLIVHCQSGTRSTKACALLHKHGFTQLHHLDGGILAWEKANLPIVNPSSTASS